MEFFADAGWDLGDDDLELPPEEPSTHASGDTDYFSPPSKGTAPTTAWTNSSPLVVDHILAGSFPTAFKLLQSQVKLHSQFSNCVKLILLEFSGRHCEFRALPTAFHEHVQQKQNFLCSIVTFARDICLPSETVQGLQPQRQASGCWIETCRTCPEITGKPKPN